MSTIYPYEKENFDMICEKCGCSFNVYVQGQEGHEEKENYYCPECHNKYTCRASLPPKVTLLKPRTDGK